MTEESESSRKTGSLWARLGGEAGVDSLLRAFYTRVLADPELAPCFPERLGRFVGHLRETLEGVEFVLPLPAYIVNLRSTDIWLTPPEVARDSPFLPPRTPARPRSRSR